MRPKAINLALGKWPQLLVALGVADERQLDGRHHPCPRDGSGVDRFRFSNRNGSGNYFCECSPKGHNGGMGLLMCCKNLRYADAARQVEMAVTHVGASNVGAGIDYEKSLKRLQLIDEHSFRVGPPVTGYLRGRGLQPTSAIRQTRIKYWHEGREVALFDAMVCKVITPDDRAATIHLTYLQDGQKANVVPNRKLMPPCRPTKGGAIRLMPAGRVLGVAEGVETALSAAALFDVPTWSCLNTTMLEQFEPPPGTEQLVIFADNDANSAGQRAAFSLAERLGRARIKTHVEIPLIVGHDFNDVLRLRLNQHLVRGGDHFADIQVLHRQPHGSKGFHA